MALGQREASMWELAAALAQTLKTKLSSINVPDGDVQTPSLEGRLLAGIVLVVIAAVAVAGCANSEAAKRAAAQAAFQAKIKADNAECQSYGAKPGSDDYVQCRLAIDVRKANAEAADEAARQQALTRP